MIMRISIAFVGNVPSDQCISICSWQNFRIHVSENQLTPNSFQNYVPCHSLQALAPNSNGQNEVDLSRNDQHGPNPQTIRTERNSSQAHRAALTIALNQNQRADQTVRWETKRQFTIASLCGQH
jgi:hypothetical protein